MPRDASIQYLRKAIEIHYDYTGLSSFLAQSYSEALLVAAVTQAGRNGRPALEHQVRILKDQLSSAQTNTESNRIFGQLRSLLVVYEEIDIEE